MMPLADTDPRIRINRTAFVVYTHQDAAKAKQFLEDFGMDIRAVQDNGIFYHGYGDEPFLYWFKPGETSAFGGACYAVESREDLVKASRVQGAGQIQNLDAPGGGEWVTIVDPIGFPVHFVYGQEKLTSLDNPRPAFVEHDVNYEDNNDKPRKGQFLRLDKGRAPVYKWGHYGTTYPEGRHDEIVEWYTKYLALAPSDQLHRDGQNIVTFFHIDRAQDFTDHHCFFLKPAKGDDLPSVAHAAFEVHDFDVQQLGHQHLNDQGYDLCWGVGRHILGSQVFDYWFDTSGFVLEHYCDGDLVNTDTPVTYGKAGPHSLKIWGPPVPTVF